MNKEIVIQINQVIDRIESALEENHTLDSMAEMACMSKFHFHRTFKLFTRETPHGFLERKRIERIANHLFLEKESSIGMLGMKFGFVDQSSLTRAFKKYYGMTPAKFRKQVTETGKVPIPQNSKIGKTIIDVSHYICEKQKLEIWMENHHLSVRQLQGIVIGYLRHTGDPRTLGSTFMRLNAWVDNQPKDLIEEQFYIIFHDNPVITQAEKVMQSVGVRLKNTNGKDISLPQLQIPAGNYLCGYFEIADHEFENAWDSMVIWLHESNYKPAEGYRFEQFEDRINGEISDKFKVNIFIPVEKIIS